MLIFMSQDAVQLWSVWKENLLTIMTIFNFYLTGQLLLSSRHGNLFKQRPIINSLCLCKKISVQNYSDLFTVVDYNDT